MTAPRPATGPPADRAPKALPTGVLYQIYPRSFCDTTGNGVGDLQGILRYLDHLAWLGVEVVWLSPIFRSPMADFGYDVADHTDVDPLFGRLADLDALIAAAHDRGLQLWLDWVPNHTSDAHPWFQASRRSRQDPKRDWYHWRDPAPDGGPPNNWRRHFADEPAWTLDAATGQYYLHQFLPEQPDVNWANPALREAMGDVLRFWLGRGVDGFRADVIHLIGKDPAFPDDPEWLTQVPRAGHHHVPITHEHLRAVRATLDEVPGAVMVGEINLPDAAQVASYVGPEQLHLAFFFGLIYAPYEARSWRDTIRYADAAFAAVGAAPTWALGNHDNPRLVTRTGSVAAARVATTVLICLRGVPVLYAGDELGLADADVPADRQVDPGGRDGCRAPLPWDDTPGRGWAAAPWLPWPPTPGSAAAQRDDPTSTLQLTRELIGLRRRARALREGSQQLPEVHPDVVAVHRWLPSPDPEAADDRARLVLANLSDAEVPLQVDLPGPWHVELTSDGSPTGGPLPDVLAGDQALLLVHG